MGEKVKVAVLSILLFVNASMLFAIRASGKRVDEVGQTDAGNEIVIEETEGDARLQAYQVAIEHDAQMEAVYLAISIAESMKDDSQSEELNFALNENEEESIEEPNSDCADSNEIDMEQKTFCSSEEINPVDEREDSIDVNETEEPVYAEIDDKAADAPNDDPAETYLGEFKFTYYCACELCCGKEDGVTASGTTATEGRTIAVDPSVIPYGSRLKVVFEDGFEAVYVAEDCGGSIKNNRIDIFVSSHSKALELGTNHGSVYLLNEG